MPKFGAPAWAQSPLDRCHGSVNFQEDFEDPEHYQARHQGIHSHWQDETCYIHREPLWKCCVALYR